MPINPALDEASQFESLRCVQPQATLLLPETQGAHSVCGALNDGDVVFKHGDAPDFFSEVSNLAVEAMTISESMGPGRKKGRLHDPVREREGEILREIGQLGFDLGTQVHMNVSSGIDPMSIYGRYVSELRRVVEKHDNAVATYRAAHPGAKIAFLLHDLSERFLHKGGLHIWWEDAALIEILVNTKVDYILWHRPYMPYAFPGVDLPALVVMDLSTSFMGCHTRYYDPDLMEAR